MTLSPQAQRALGIGGASLTPDELVSRVLQAPVDLLWNGGIGTYVKASGESHADVGDKVNDAVRVDADQLRCRVVGEGGNLGFTQRARIEYASAGGRINTDAIDNSAGVDCSDHEVNIKILLDQIVADGDLTLKQRDALMAEMTDEVAALVLRDNYLQTQALSNARPRRRGWSTSTPATCAHSSTPASSTGTSSSCPTTRSWRSVRPPVGGSPPPSSPC